MKMPKSVMVGETEIVVQQPDGLKLDKDVCRGAYYRSDNKIIVAKGNPERNVIYDVDERANTFWHELTHVILQDMGERRLNANEKFVSAFADRLHQAIKTARF
jgi:hypothetical protein